MVNSMNILKKCYYKITCRISNDERVKIARKLGVIFSEEAGKEQCTILTDPFSLFGTEPYLIRVGKHVEFTLGVRLITHDGGMWVLRQCADYANCDYFSPITIGNNVFIGNNTIILPGVSIGNNCIIGAGSIVSKDIPDNSVFAGVPASFIKSIDDYALKVNKSGLVRSKGMSKKQKEKEIRKKHPEWF